MKMNKFLNKTNLISSFPLMMDLSVAQGEIFKKKSVHVPIRMKRSFFFFLSLSLKILIVTVSTGGRLLKY
jgi:hypothetical protein